METTVTTENNAIPDALVIRKRCDCGSTMSHVVYEEVTGWLCDDPGCGNFIPDAGVSANGTA